MQTHDIEERLKDFRYFLFLIWKHLGLPDPTPIQNDKATNQGGIGGYDPLNPHPFDTQYPDIADNLPIPVEQPQEPQDREHDTADKTATGN